MPPKLEEDVLVASELKILGLRISARAQPVRFRGYAEGVIAVWVEGLDFLEDGLVCGMVCFRDYSGTGRSGLLDVMVCDICNKSYISTGDILWTGSGLLARKVNIAVVLDQVSCVACKIMGAQIPAEVSSTALISAALSWTFVLYE